MNAPPDNPARSRVGGLYRSAAQSCLLTLLAANAQAQTPACDQLKNTLAKRLPADVRSYSMEAVPADTPVTPGTKVIGTCEGGAYKVVYRRWGGAVQASPGSASAARPLAASAPVAAPKPVSPSITTAAAPAAARQESVSPPLASASDVAAAASSAGRAVVPAVQPDQASETQEQRPQPGPGFLPGFVAEFMAESMGRHWRWILALLALPVAGSLWFWIAHRRAYDEAGLPRGPRL